MPKNYMWYKFYTQYSYIKIDVYSIHTSEIFFWNHHKNIYDSTCILYDIVIDSCFLRR